MKNLSVTSAISILLLLPCLSMAQALHPKSEKQSPQKTISSSGDQSLLTGFTLVWQYTLQPNVTRMEYGASPAIADMGQGVNNFGGEPGNYLEIITGSDEYANVYPELNSDAYGIWRCFDALGNVEWARDTKSDESKSSVAIADIDYNLQPDLAGGTTSGWCIEVMNKFGSWTAGVPDASWTFPYEPQRNGSFMWHSSPAIGELITGPNHEGLEIVGGNNPLMSIWALDGDNVDGIDDGITANLTNWNFPGPTGTEGTDWDVLWVYKTNGSIIASPAIDDIDGDGQAEVICGSKDSALYCLNGTNGSLKWKFTTKGMITSSAGIADFNNDGKKEIVVGSQDSLVYFFRGDINNNGIIDTTEVTTFATGGVVMSSPAIADFDADGTPDVVIGSGDGKIYCLQYNPATNSVVDDWTYQTGGHLTSSPAVANSGRTLPTIYIGSGDGFLYVLNGNGSLIGTYNAGGEIITSPSVADVDGDHKLEIAFTAWAFPDKFILVRDNESNVDSFATPWPMFRHDSRHTGCYTWTPPVYNDDVAVEDILEPDGTISSGAIITPRVKIYNDGVNTATNFTLTFQVTNAGGTMIYNQTQTIASLLPDTSAVVVFPTLVAVPGHFHTRAFTFLTGDGEEDDNVEYGSYEVIQSQWVEDFENNNGGLTLGPLANGWEWGVPTSGPMAAYTGTKVWATNLSGNYANNASWPLSSPLYTAGSGNPVLSFYHWYNMEENRDGGNLKISLNGGPFQLVFPVGGYPGIATWDNMGIPDQPCFTGQSNGWQLVSFVLPVDSGQHFNLKWEFGSDNVTNGPGWYIDHLMGSGFGPGLVVTATASQVLCHGDSATVTVEATGGTPPYTGTGVITRAAGTYNFIVTDSLGISGYTVVTITEPELLTASISVVPDSCAGILTLTCLTSGGTPDFSYFWSDGSMGQSITEATPGFYSVTVTDLNQCIAISEAEVTSGATINVSITASANPVTAGTAVVFTAVPVNAGTDPVFDWEVNYQPDGNNSSTYTYTPVDGDIVRCLMTTGNNCMVISNEITMTVTTGIPPVVNLQNILVADGDENCYNATGTITVAGNGTTFIVESGGIAKMIAGQKITYLPGVMVYAGGYMKGKISTDGEYCTFDAPLDLNGADAAGFRLTDNQNPGYRVYPNPSDGYFILTTPDNRQVGPASAEITDILGHVMIRQDLPDSRSYKFDLRDFRNGIYFLRISTKYGSETIKLIKDH